MKGSIAFLVLVGILALMTGVAALLLPYTQYSFLLEDRTELSASLVGFGFVGTAGLMFTLAYVTKTMDVRYGRG